MALLISASASVAATCKSDPNECTPKKLCKEATNLKGGNAVWSKARNDAKHVRFAQGLGMSCGVVAIVEPCDLDANECKISQLCEKATKSNGGQTVWNSAAQNYVDVAKEYELTCGIKAKTTSLMKTCSAATPEACTTSDICRMATSQVSNVRAWYGDFLAQGYVKEAKKRGLNCGVGTTNTSWKTCTSRTPDACPTWRLCSIATKRINGKPKTWRTLFNFKPYVKEAKKRGLNCGVGDTTTSVTKTCTSKTPDACSVTAICKLATLGSSESKTWAISLNSRTYVKEAKKRGLSCGVKAKTTFGEIRRGWLGVRIQDVDEDSAASIEGLDRAAGIMVVGVPDGPANDAGMLQGDVIVIFDGHDIEDARDFVQTVGNTEVEKAVDVIVVRDGKKMTLSVTLGLRDDEKVARAGSVTKTCSAKTREACSVRDICDRATRQSGETKTWETSSYGWGYVKEAKKRGLTCGVKAKTAAVTKTCTSKTPEACSVAVLCISATKGKGDLRKWDTGYRFKPYITEAKKRGLTCGVKAKTAAVTKTCSLKTPEACSVTAICNAATYTEDNSKFWNDEAMYASYVKEAKKRGLTCGIEIANFDKSDFLNLSSLNRKQLQYGLKKLGYYTSSIDGLYGPNTQRAVRGYAAAKGISSGYPNSIYNRIVSDVNVPSSFAVASRPSTSSSSSSSSTSGVSDANKTLLGGLFIAGVCALTPDVGACLDGAMGNSPSTSSSSTSNRPVSSSCNSNYDCAYRSVCIKKAGRGQCMELPRGTSRSNFKAIKCSGSFDCPSRSKCDRTYKICVKR